MKVLHIGNRWKFKNTDGAAKFHDKGARRMHRNRALLGNSAIAKRIRAVHIDHADARAEAGNAHAMRRALIALRAERMAGK